MTGTDPEFSPSMDPRDDALQPFDVRDSSGRQGLIKLLIGFGLLLVAAFIVMKLYKPGVRDRNDPPRITAENTPFKVPPAEVGGAQTPDQDKSVFDVMDGKAPDGTITTAPGPEVPIKIPQTATINVEEPIKVAPAPKPKPVVTTPRPTVTIPRPSTTVAAGNSEWVVQVASVRSQADAGNVWTEIRRKYPSIVTDSFYADVRQVDLAEKGIYFRTRLAGLADKSAAQDMCNALKASGQACFVTRR